MKQKQIKKIIFKTKKEWRNWLSENHDKEEGVILVRYKKHTGKPSFNQRDAMDEAICFGWIDTTIKRIDDDKYGVSFVKRKKTSKWSKATLSHAGRLIKEKKMSPAGLKAYKEGLKKPTHDHGIPDNPTMPEDLNKELNKKKNKKAKENFNKFFPSYKKIYFKWILSAKLPKTRKKRIREVVDRAREKKKLG